jgi:hypothetical protein
MFKFIVATIALTLFLGSALAEEKEKLKIIGEETSITVETDNGPVEITRIMTPCAKNKGVLQPLIPAQGVNPVTEIEVLEALKDPEFAVVDMRTIEWRVKGSIPGSIHIHTPKLPPGLTNSGARKLVKNSIAQRQKKLSAFAMARSADKARSPCAR